MVITSQKYQLISEDLKSWAKNALVFAAPALLVLLASFKDIVPADWKYAALFLWALNEAAALLKKWLEQNKYIK